MAEDSTTEPTAEKAEAPDSNTGLRGRISRLLQWAGDSKLRMGMLATLFIAVFGGLFATWSYLAHLAVTEEDQFTLKNALAALDDQDYEEAKNIVAEMQEKSDPTPQFGGSLFVLGAVKAAQADLEWSQDRQRAMHLVAARYLQKARELGIPPGRESQAELLLGQSRIHGNQPAAGIEVITRSLEDPQLPKTAMHFLLAEAYQAIPEPNLMAALEHIQAALTDAKLDPAKQSEARIVQADLLGQMGRLDSARQQLQLAGDQVAQQAKMKSIAGRLAIRQAEQLPQGEPQRSVLARQAIADLREAQRLDPLSSQLTRQAMYWIGYCYQVMGDQQAALAQYDQLGKSYGDTAESLTAMMAKADLNRVAGNSEQALANYRSVLDSIGNPVTYVNRLLPLSALKKRFQAAYEDFVRAEKFEAAQALANALPPLFSLAEVTELRARLHDRWAAVSIARSQDVPHKVATKVVKAGRYHHRAAGAAYELLAQLQYASPNFTSDLWNAAESYFAGQSYSHAERMLEEYLHHEAREKQALALLRLGQVKLALGKNKEAIETLTECIEMYPSDSVVYQARIECAQAHLQLDEGEVARELLLKNLYGGGLEPPVSEWRDSLFLLGSYLHNAQQHSEAIEKLDEAVRRYPDAPQALLARYSIARSYHNAAKQPAVLAATAKTESERQKNRKARDKNLRLALEEYLQVQRLLTLQGHVDSNALESTLLRNCYKMQGSVLFELKRYEEARKAYANITTVYQNEPFVLESFVQVANCYRRLDKPTKAKGTIEQAKLVLNRFPADTDFKVATNFSRQSWELLLNEMSQW